MQTQHASQPAFRCTVEVLSQYSWHHWLNMPRCTVSAFSLTAISMLATFLDFKHHQTPELLTAYNITLKVNAEV